MNLSQQALLKLLSRDSSSSFKLESEDIDFLKPSEVASLYIYAALLVTIMGYIKEQLWLYKNENLDDKSVTSYKDFIIPLFVNELTSISFLKDLLLEKDEKGIKELLVLSQKVECQIIELMISWPKEDQKEFLKVSLKEMNRYFIIEENNQEGRAQELGHNGLRLYRTFDRIDELFGLNYNLDQAMLVDHDSKERLYQRTGVGVQSGYSTILLSLYNSNVPIGGKIIDLGSGYGRVGLVYSLLRSDIEFIGYEYVPHRVDSANKASLELGLQERLKFITQDLSISTFIIPEADIYYLYDPFTEETYQFVLKQIIEISKQKNVTVVTKGNANHWLSKIANDHGWPQKVVIDYGNLCIFKNH